MAENSSISHAVSSASGSQEADASIDAATTDPPAASATEEQKPTSEADRKAQRREEFLDAADAAIKESGAGVTMAGVAARAGVTKPVLYRYIADKDDLVTALAERYARRLQGVLAKGLSSEGGARRVLRSTVDAYLGFIESEPEMYTFLMSQGSVELPGAREYLDNFSVQVGDRVGLIIAEEMTKVGRDPSVGAVYGHAIVGMVDRIGLWWLSQVRKQDTDQAEDTDIMLDDTSEPSAGTSREDASNGSGNAPSMTRPQLVDHIVKLMWSGLHDRAAHTTGSTA